MNFIRTRGIVIKKRDLGEADRIITIFSENFGKLDLLIKGIRKSKKRDQSSTDMLAYSDFTFYKKGDAYILSNIDLMEGFYDLRKDIEKLEIASYIVSVINEVLLPGERKKEFFQRFKKALEFIIENESCKNYLMVLRMMDWIVKKEGYLIMLEGENYFNISESSIINDKILSAIPLKKELYGVFKAIQNNDKIFLEGDNLKESIIEVIILYEKYLNYHLDTKINLRKYLLEGTHVKYS